MTDHQRVHSYSPDIYSWNRVTTKEKSILSRNVSKRRSLLSSWFHCFSCSQSVERDWHRYQHRIDIRSNRRSSTFLGDRMSWFLFDGSVKFRNLCSSKTRPLDSICHCHRWSANSLVLERSIRAEFSRVHLQQSVRIRLICTSSNCLIDRRFFAVNRVLYLSW